MRKVSLRWAMILVILAPSVAGLYNVPDELPDAVGPWQKLVTECAIVYGFAGVVAAIGLMLRRPWALYFLIAWAGACVLAGSLAPVVYGEQPVITGLVSGAVTLFLVALIYRGARKSLKE